MLNDKSARESVKYIIRDHMLGKLEEKGITAWTLDAVFDTPPSLRTSEWDGVGIDTKDKKVVVATPSFAFDEGHNTPWTKAMDMLDMWSPPPVSRLEKVQVQKTVERKNKRHFEGLVHLLNAKKDPPPVFP